MHKFLSSLTFKIIIGALILFLISGIDILFRHKGQNRQIDKFMTKILDDWVQGDMSFALSKWKYPDNYPPITNMTGYEIISAKLSDHWDRKNCYEVIARLDFIEGGVWPNRKKWEFVVEKKLFGLTVREFKQLE